MRQYFFEFLTLVLLGGSLAFFLQCLDYLAQRDYVAALIMTLIGLATITVGRDMARLALVQKEER